MVDADHVPVYILNPRLNTDIHTVEIELISQQGDKIETYHSLMQKTSVKI